MGIIIRGISRISMGLGRMCRFISIKTASRFIWVMAHCTATRFSVSYHAEVDEGYAMPIPPKVRHGYVNDSTMQHHVPFIFGSLTRGGWGVFLDVEAQPIDLDKLEKAPVYSRQMESDDLSGT